MGDVSLFVRSGCLLLAGALLFAAGRSAAAEEAKAPAVKRGDVAFQARFDTEEEQKGWSKAAFAQWLPGHKETPSLCVTVPAAEATGSHMIRLPVDLSRYRGCKLQFECLVKAENVSKPPESYNGVKFMFHFKSAEGPHWLNQNNVFGTFDWKKISLAAYIPEEISGAEIDLGLQNSAGTVWFDEIRVTVAATPRPPRPKPADNPAPAFKGHNLPRLRGAMSPNTFKDEDLRVLGQEWNANLIRWQMTRNWGKTGTERDLTEYNRWIDAELDDLDKVLEAAGRYGIKVVVDLHSPPGGRVENRDLAICHEPVYQDAFVAVWEKIAHRYKGNKAVWGYDLVNEPQQNAPPPEGVPDFLGIQVRAARAIRAIDPTTPIIFEADEWDSASAFKNLDPVDVPNAIYQVHMYVPGEFTHQGVHGSKTGVSYPGKIGATEWNKEALRKVLAPVREFQRAYNVHIYCGEFSAIRWAPGDSAYRYLKDCIELFEEYGWDWSYHAYREWDGWSVEHGPDEKDRQPTKEPTNRKKLLLEWFAKNKKP